MSDPAKVPPVTAEDITPLDMPIPTGEPVASAIGDTNPVPHTVGDIASEADAAGVPYDPTRHLHRRHPSTGRWMPRGGRRPKSSSSAASGAGGVSYIPPEVPAPPPSSEDAKTPGASSADAARSAESEDQADAAGECAARALQFSAGVVFDAPDDCTPAGPEHRGMVRAFAAYIRAKGWQGTAGTAVFLVIAAWLLRVLTKEKPRSTIRGWIDHAKAKAAHDVTPADAVPRPISTAAATASATQPVSTVIDLPPHIPPLAPSSRS